MKIGLALRELHRSERKLARDLSTLAARHRTEHEVYHVALDVAAWSRNHLRLLADAASRYDVDLDGDPRTRALTGPLQEKVAVLLGRRPEPGLLLLADLRHLHRVAAGASLDWELLAQSAQAVGDSDLLAVCQRCHPETLRQMRWANSTLKILSPQVLTS